MVKHIYLNRQRQQIKSRSSICYRTESYRYSDHYMIIKCVDFEPIHYAINLDVLSFFKVYNEFDYLF